MSSIGKGSRLTQHPVQSWSVGSFLCPGCSSFVSLGDYPVLATISCPYCGADYFTPKKVGKFWLFEHLGGGGGGAVYKAYHESSTSKSYAVKILPPTSSKKLIGSLEEEAQIMERLRSHACIANSLAWGEYEGEHFIAMEFVDGERMDRKIKRLGKLSEPEMLLIILRLLAAETHIYNRGFLYRDMKPQNVILNPQMGAYLYDFGICVTIEQALDDSAELIAGTPMYFPPERLTGEGERVSSEIYSLGMLFYNGVTGQNFFTNRELEAMAARDTLPAMLLNKNKMEGIAPDVAEVITRMIQRNPKKRYQTFIEVERDVVRLLWVRAKRAHLGKLLLPEPGASRP